MTAATVAIRERNFDVLGLFRRNAWTLGLLALLLALFAFTKYIQPDYAEIGVQGLMIGIVPLALAAVAQAIVVISGGIDLSIGSIVALTNVTAAVLLENQTDPAPIAAILIGVIVMGLVLGAINGGLIVVTKVPDIVVTLAMSYVWAGCALLVLATPGGSAVPWLTDLPLGSFLNPWIPKAAVLLVLAVLIVWIPLRRSRLGLSMYAAGGNQLAAFRSGVPIGRTKIAAYAVMGLFAGLAGLAVTANTNTGIPVPGQYTLPSVAAVVLGGVSLAGGRGGVAGPIIAVLILQMIRTDMTLLGLDPNLATVLQGVILIGVLMIGTLIQVWRARG